MENNIIVKVKLKANDMFCFLMNYTYSSIAGIIGVLFSIGSVVLLIKFWGQLDIAYKFMLIVCALLFTVINPVLLYKKAKLQVNSSPALKETMTYIFDNKGIHMAMGGEKASVAWEDIFKIKRIAGRYMFYTSRVRANIIPISAFENEEDIAGLAVMIKEHYKKR